MKIPILMKHKTNLKGQKRKGAQAYLWRHPSVGSRLCSHLPLLTSMSCHTKVRDLYDLFSEEDIQGDNLVLGWMPWEKYVPCSVISTDSCKIQDNQIQHFRELQLEIETARPNKHVFLQMQLDALEHCWILCFYILSSLWNLQRISWRFKMVSLENAIFHVIASLGGVNSDL